jgi:aryl-alcohol dehydrogenase-like predicted oxidoreductase
VTLGRTGLEVGRLGIAASYGVPAAAVERAFERGVNYLYWGTLRRDAFAQAIRNLAPRRDRMVMVVQSYSRVAGLVGWSLERALRKLRLDHADILLFGLWNRPLPPRIVEAGLKLQQRGLARHLALSTHHRPLAAQLASDERFGALHVRYNAEHPGAERDIFPLLPAINRPGIVSFTATSWGRLLDRRRTPPGEPVPTSADCYRFVLSNPAVDVCLTGPSSEEQVTQALEALDRGPMPPEEIAWMRRVGSALT